MDALEASLDAIGHRLHDLYTRWWTWPAVLAVLGAVVLAISALATPVGEDVHLFGFDLFGPCEFQEATGRPCGSCGMTRSWVWAARLQLSRAWAYNPAGSLLFIALVGSGAVGLTRLITRRPGLLAIPWKVVALCWLGWATLLGSQMLRGMFG